jgi:membrane protein
MVATDRSVSWQGVERRNWRDIAVRLFNEVMEDRVMLVAAGATYYMLVAMVPALTLVVSIYGLFSDPADVPRQLSLFAGILPQGALDIVGGELTRLASTGRPTLGITLIISLGIALWSANAGVGSLFDAMNIAYDEQEKRNFFVRTLLSLVFTLLLAVAGIIFIGVVLVIPIVMQFLAVPNGFDWLVKIASYLLMLVLLVAGMSALYRWGPSWREKKKRRILPGALFAALGIAIVSVVFSWYAANFSNYNATYGSLGALIGLLTWMWLSNTVVITGAELNAVLEGDADRKAAHGALSEPVRYGEGSDNYYWLVALGLIAVLALASRQPENVRRERRR